MAKKGWLVDAGVGLLLTLAVAACYVRPQQFSLIENLELKSFDRRSKLRQTLEPSPDIVLVAIDDDSIAQLGRWPWPRTRIADLLDKLETAKPRVVGLDIVYSEPEQNEGLAAVQQLESKYQELKAGRKLVDRGGAFEALFSSAVVKLDSDSRLEASLRAAGNVVLPMMFTGGAPSLSRPQPLSATISSSTVRATGRDTAPELDGIKAAPPIERFADVVRAVGQVDVQPDVDGVVRREQIVWPYAGQWMPSFAAQLAFAAAGVKPQDVVLTPGKSLKFGASTVPLDEDSMMLISYAGPKKTFRAFPYSDVMNDRVALDGFKDKIVIVGLTALGVGTSYVTPLDPTLSSVELTANALDDMLRSRYITRPAWAMQLELGLIAFIGLFVMLLLPRLKALWGFLISAMLLLGLVGLGMYFFVNGQWIKIAYAGTLLTVGYVLIISRRFFTTEKGKELVEASAIETNKMLGLSFQGQGMLDLAFEKFRLCPLDDSMKETLYNLSLDYERKRQFAKAANVLEHIAKKDPKYKDVVEKGKKLKDASEGAVFGGIGGAKKEGTVMITGGATKPTLGRYEIEKELGRGAMGIVYLGKDPKINRQVAIKTMVLEEGSDAAEAKAVKERFFREAESAGTLNHPNIVRIFDAGEEQDVAYIAMELLDGRDLVPFCAKDKLLAPDVAMEYVAKVADALDYAHEKGIVHRDIKPANIMLLKDGTIRVADFGIARITASSKTATGTVMGTPSYMSPEQVAGKKVDGRSDLFSLTVALYELLTGEKPWKGGEGIGTLLFQIANDPHPDPVSINPALPPCVKAILDKGLAKNPDERYARGSALAGDLRTCVAAMKSGGKIAPPPVLAPAPVEEPKTISFEPQPAQMPDIAPAPVSAAPVEEPKTVDFTPLSSGEAPPPALADLPPWETAKPAEAPGAANGSEPSRPQSGADGVRTIEFELPGGPSNDAEPTTVSLEPAAPPPAPDPDATIRLTPPPKEPS